MGMDQPWTACMVSQGWPALQSPILRNGSSLYQWWKHKTRRYHFSTAKYISAELHSELAKRCKPEYGDILYTKGGTTGIARVNTEVREFGVWVHVAVLKLADSIDRFYLQHALNSQFCYRQSQRYTHGVGNQDLGLTRMIWITLPLPSLIEQKEIVTEIERRVSIADEVQKTVDADIRRAERLRQSILKKAFSGELVPQILTTNPRKICLPASESRGISTKSN